MKIEFVPSDAEVGKTGVIAVLAFEKAALAGAAAELDRRTGGALARAIAGGRFTGAKGQTLDLIAPHGLEAARVLIVGAGAEGEFDERALELIAAAAYQAVKMSGADSLTLRLPGVARAMAAHAALGVRLAAYRFDRYRTKEKAEKKPSITKVRIAVDDPSRRQEGVQGRSPAWPTPSSSPATWSPSRPTSSIPRSSPAG